MTRLNKFFLLKKYLKRNKVNIMVKTIIFDLDGTLYPEKKFAESGFRAVAEYVFKQHKISQNKVFGILFNDFKKGIRNKNFNVLLKKIGLENNNVEKLIKIYRSHYPKKIVLYPDALKFLKNNNKNFKLGLITNGHKITQTNKISALSIRKYFKAIFIATEFGDNDWEKSMASFNFLLKKIKSKPEETIYIGDNPKRDFMGAKKMGILTIRIKRKNGDCYNILANNKNKANFEVSSLISLNKIIKKIHRVK
jgi:putative hydrolase of the HAD superfamily